MSIDTKELKLTNEVTDIGIPTATPQKPIPEPKLGVPLLPFSDERKQAIDFFKLGMSYDYNDSEKNARAGFENLQKSANLNYEPAMLTLATVYYGNGKGGVLAAMDVNERKRKALLLVEKLVFEHRYPPAYAILARYYRSGFGGTPINIERAEECLRKAIDAGSSECEYELGCLYLNNKGTETKYKEEGIQLIHRAADSGWIYAQRQLAMYYKMGQYVQQNPERAFHYLDLATKNKGVDEGGIAHFYKGVCYLERTGVDEDLKLALECFEKAHLLGHPEGKLYSGLVKVKANESDDAIKEAISIFMETIAEIDSKQGLIPERMQNNRWYANYNLGLCYHTLNDLEQAKHYFRQGLNHNNMHKLGLAKCCLESAQKCADIDENGLKNKNSEYKHAIELLLDLTRCGEQSIERDAYFHLGKCHFLGLGVDVNKAQAYRYFKEAEKRGDQYCYLYLAKCLKGGYGLEKPDPKEAIRYLNMELARVESKDYEVTVLLAGYLLEEGTEHFDPNAAKLMLKKIADRKNVPAANALAICYLKGFGVPVDTKKALEHLEKLHKKIIERKKMSENDVKNLAEVENNLGWFLLNGIGIHETEEKKGCESLNVNSDINPDKKPDHIKRAIQLFESAIENGSTDAMINLAWCYMNGIGVPQNRVTAIQLFRQSAELDNRESHQQSLGLYYAHGCKDDTDLEILLQDKPDCLNNLGLCYLYGFGVRKDVTKALDILQRSAEKDIIARINLFYCFAIGESGIAPDLEKAKGLFVAIIDELEQTEDASQDRICQSLNAVLDRILDKGDRKLGIAIFEFIHSLNLNVTITNQLAEQHLKLGQEFEAIFTDKLTKSDYTDLSAIIHATAHYERSASLGNPLAHKNLAWIYDQGWQQASPELARSETIKVNHHTDYMETKGIPEKITERELQLRRAFYHYQQAAFGGDIESMFNLATFYEQGLIVEKDMALATYWYSMADNFAPAIKRLADIYAFGIDNVPKDFDKAVQLYTKTYHTGNPADQEYAHKRLLWLSDSKLSQRRTENKASDVAVNEPSRLVVASTQ